MAPDRNSHAIDGTGSSELRLRILSALVLLPIALGTLWLGGLIWLALMAACTVGCLWEWRRLCARGAAEPGRVLAGAAAIVLAGACLAWLRIVPPDGRDLVLLLLVVVWASDVGAYAFGRSLGASGVGGRQLAPQTSPAKTWAGALGGLASALLAGAVTAHAAFADPLYGLAAGLLLGLFVQLGDYLESAAKRQFGVKDSGTLIPGHGGLLDRLDGLIAAAPVAAAMTGTGLGLLAGCGLAACIAAGLRSGR